MIYVVTGRHRTGTSMMMHALSQCMPAVFDMDWEQTLRNRVLDPENYDPNPNGFWSTQRKPHEVPSGSVMKCSMLNWMLTEPGEYRIVQMVRDEADRRRSMARAFGSDDGLVFGYEQSEALLPFHQPLVVDYYSVIDHPLLTFEVMRQHGWPIDPAKCAEVVDPSLWRHR